MNKKCICGKVITSRFDLCSRCIDEYGTNRSEWPDWLKFLISDMKREAYQEKQIDKHEITFTDLWRY